MSQLIEHAIKQLQKDLKEVKRELGKLGVRVEPEVIKQDELFFIYIAISRGYKESFTYSSML